LNALESLAGFSTRQTDLSLQIALDPHSAGRMVVTLSGSLDNNNGHAFVKDFEAVIRESSGLNSIQLEVTELKYISSSGAGALATIAMAASAKGIDFSLVNPCKKVMMVLCVLGFDKFLCADDTEVR